MPRYSVQIRDITNQFPRADGIFEAQTPEDAAKQGLEKAWRLYREAKGIQHSTRGWNVALVTVPGREGTWRWKIGWTQGQPQVILGAPVSGIIPV
jgi:hypothetical protein